MTDDNNQATNEPMPSSETLEPTGTQTVSPETEIAPGASAEDSNLTGEVSDRTAQQFEKLTESNRQLREDLDSLKSQNQPVAPEQLDKPLYDPKTGYVDIEALEGIRRDAKEAKEEAKQARERLTSSNAESQLRDLYSAHPELKNPSTDEAKEFFDEAERIYIHAASFPDKYDGKSLTQKEAADMAKKRLGPDAEKVAETVSTKEQAGISATGKPSQGVASQTAGENQKRLELGTRLGDDKSITERMRNIRLQGKES